MRENAKRAAESAARSVFGNREASEELVEEASLAIALTGSRGKRTPDVGAAGRDAESHRQAERKSGSKAQDGKKRHNGHGYRGGADCRHHGRGRMIDRFHVPETFGDEAPSSRVSEKNNRGGRRESQEKV
jgi:hypothetical protein